MKNSRQLLSALSLLLIYFSLTFFSTKTCAQSGLLHNSSEAVDGYVLFDYYHTGDTYLMNNCGEIVHVWEGVTQLSLHAKLLPNGNLLYVKTGTLYEIDWDGNLVKSHTLNIPGLSLAYEQIKLPNGNYLCVGRRSANPATFDSLGFNTMTAFPTLMDIVVEIDYETGAIVWEWNIFDHVIQERDPNVGNYGSIVAHPELLDMDALSTYDWTNDETFMINGMDYNPDLDQIVLSVRKLGEIIIIDHSTSTSEAASHSGGNSGKGGDILYRWGNPQNYGRGIETDQFLFLQHNPIWITDGPHKGKIMCYNNGLERSDPSIITPYSDVPILTTPVDSIGNYTLGVTEPFEPIIPDVLLSGNETTNPFYSGYMGGSQHFPNENIYITESMEGRFVEYNVLGEVVWEYQLPNFLTPFRSEKYTLDYPAFVGKDLTPEGFVPFTNNPVQCDSTSSVHGIALGNEQIQVKYLGNRNYHFDNKAGNAMIFQIFDMHGKLQIQGQSNNEEHTLSLFQLANGIYNIHVVDTKSKKASVHKVFLR